MKTRKRLFEKKVFNNWIIKFTRFRLIDQRWCARVKCEEMIWDGERWEKERERIEKCWMLVWQKSKEGTIKQKIVFVLKRKKRDKRKKENAGYVSVCNSNSVSNNVA